MPLTVIYNCVKCHLGKRVEYDVEAAPGRWARLVDGKPVFPGSALVAVGKDSPKIYVGDPLGRCPGCGGTCVWGPLRATYNPDVECDPRCTHARGMDCSCSCGGANHGIHG